MPSKNRVEHKFQGDNEDLDCLRCGKPYRYHRKPRQRIDVRQRDERIYGVNYQNKRHPMVYVGIDGEGLGRENHVYTLLAASDETGEHTWSVENQSGLTVLEVCEFLSAFPPWVKLFSYGFNYDLTKMLEDLPDPVIYKLFRPEMRQRLGSDAFKGPRHVPWGEWRFNMQGTKFSVRNNKDRRYTVIWDIIRFFQSKFTVALTDWKIGLKHEIEEMARMKDQRAQLDKKSWQEVIDYNLSECRFMAALARKLTEAHDKADIALKSYYGAGSSATAILTKWNVRQFMQDPPEAMRIAVAMAFSGGRFDNSMVGMVRGKVYGGDISAAYPYGITNLPCLVHGRWERTINRSRMLKARLALVRYTLRDSVSVNTKTQGWGPFPFRTPDGSICYPAVSGGGWVWKEEFLAGERIFPNVEFQEAWCFYSDCNHMPFAEMPKLYLERLAIGKEGAGIAMKLGMNSCPGKTVQSVGNGPFKNWVWGGNINSGCRAQVLDVLGLHKNWQNMLMVATDGYLSLEKIDHPKPVDTGTFEASECKAHKRMCDICPKESQTFKPLGGWERKDSDRGVFIARAGVYFPLNPSADDIQTVRGRGVGRGVILENWERIVNRFEDWNKKPVPADYDREDFDRDGWPLVHVANVSRFCGAKSSITRTLVDGKWQYHRARGNHLPHRGKDGKMHHGEPHYGQWVTREVAMSFNPKPKRESRALCDDGRSLILRKFPENLTSAPYDKAVISEEARQLMLMALEANEQPDADLADYEDYDDYNA